MSSRQRRRVAPNPTSGKPGTSSTAPQVADHYLRSIGIELHSGSTREEIDRAVRIYRASW